MELKSKLSKTKDRIRTAGTKINLNKVIPHNAVYKIKNSKIVGFLKSAKFIKIIIWFFAFIALAQIVFAVLIYGFRMENKTIRTVIKIVPYPAAVVNQDFITVNQYYGEKDYIHHFYQSTEQEGIDYAAIDSEIINQLIENKLIVYEASKENIVVKKTEVDDTINQIIEQNGGQEKVEKVLNDLYGLNISKFRKLVEIQLLREKISNELIAKVSVQHILARVDSNAPDDQVNAALEKIKAYRQEIIDGKDFGQQAKDHSEDVGSAESGGVLEPFADGEMVPEFSKAAFLTPVGEISEPVRTEFGWHIIKVVSKTGIIEKSFADWLAQIKDKSLIWEFYK